jgi:hypothetical protein
MKRSIRQLVQPTLVFYASEIGWTYLSPDPFLGDFYLVCSGCFALCQNSCFYNAGRYSQHVSPQTEATLEQDASIVETYKQNTLFSYKGSQSYQPLSVYWAELVMVWHAEFRDGNVTLRWWISWPVKL